MCVSVCVYVSVLTATTNLGPSALSLSYCLSPSHTHILPLVPRLPSLIEGYKQSVVGVTMVKAD